MRRFFNNVSLLFLLTLLGGFICWSCTEDENTESSCYVKPGIYRTDIILYAEEGEESETRGLDINKGEFTNVYPFDYIYIHSADNKEDGTHRSLKVSLIDVLTCNDCRGIHLEVEVFENEQGYTITNDTGEKITLGNDEKIYFSTIADPYWKAKVEGATPVYHQDVFVESEANKELLRSIKTYDKAELIKLLNEDRFIEMKRYCTGFRLYFMFTNVDSTNFTNIVNEQQWEDSLYNSRPKDFYIKLYLGPNFCHRFDMYNLEVASDDIEYGYYSTGNRSEDEYGGQQYRSFGNVAYAYTGGVSGGTNYYQGFGYETDSRYYLLATLNTRISASEFSVYAFIKYAPQADPTDKEFLRSDEGSKYFRAKVPDMALTLNRVHFIVMIYDIKDLRAFFESSSRGSSVLSSTPWNTLEKIDLKPVKVICQ